MVDKRFGLIFGFSFLLVFMFSFVSAWDFYGYTYDTTGNVLYNASINITIWSMNAGGPPSYIGSNSSYSNETGLFNFSVTENSNWMYKPVIQHFEKNKTDGSTSVDYVGQSLPQFPFGEFNETTDINFYLKEAGTINITAVNATGSAKNFQYVIKDTILGYPIEENFGTYVSSATVYVPRDRNYTIQIYPNESMPVSYHWNNFSADSDYTITEGLSDYNLTTHTLNKTFNCSENLVWISGYALNTTGNVPYYDEFTVIPFVLEAGNMVYLGDDAAMPYNMSAWRVNGTGSHVYTDNYSLSTGFYNITLPGTAESTDYILFATAKNGTDYYGGYRNISLNYSSSDNEINFTMYKLMGTNWGEEEGNFTMNDATTWQNINISSARQQFNLVNDTNAILENVSAHIEVTIDYSDYNATEFTFMLDTSGTGDSSFYIPLINETGIKEINVYSQMYAPKRIDTASVAEILTDFCNISLSQFNPKDIDEGLDASNIFIKFYLSSSTCDVPNPPDGCGIGAFGPDENQSRDNFSPLSAIIGGGALSFRMGYGNISVHYANVDMLASGPPDMEFENDAGDSEIITSFENAIKFGSTGPTIYDYVLVSMPYKKGSSSQTGLNDEQDVNISIPLFYDMDWDIIWDTTANGTSGSNLAGNYSHYSTYSSEWQTLMGNNTCITNVSNLNSTNPCYIDTDNNQIWIRLPHFSGTAPTITGLLLTATTIDDDDDDTPSGGGSRTPSFWTSTFVVNEEQFAEGFTRQRGVGERFRLTIGGEEHYVGVVEVGENTAKINVSSDPQEATLQIGDERRFDVTGDNYYDILVTLKDIVDGEADITVKSISEEVTEETEAEESEKEEDAFGGEAKEDEDKKSKTWIIIVIILVLIVLIGAGIAKKKKQ